LVSAFLNYTERSASQVAELLQVAIAAASLDTGWSRCRRVGIARSSNRWPPTITSPSVTESATCLIFLLCGPVPCVFGPRFAGVLPLAVGLALAPPPVVVT
jgi:hypothetical protein